MFRQTSDNVAGSVPDGGNNVDSAVKRIVHMSQFQTAATM